LKTLEGVKVGFAISGSFCTIGKIFQSIRDLVNEGACVYPIMSKNASSISTRFGTSEEFLAKLKDITGNEIATEISETEPIGPKNLYDALIVAPCTGNTMAKMANAITDTSVLMAIKATLRNNKPVILAIASNDGLGLNMKNIGTLINTRHVYFVPFGQDNYAIKEKSLVSKMDLIYDTLMSALVGKQLQPIITTYDCE
jgi:dipicolinate synthase subunit B